ncbi:MAG: ABC transporter permease [Oscillospiraceae bacterium]|nr:ABC transporter permease [Oscillospiraceae bacterium]
MDEISKYGFLLMNLTSRDFVVKYRRSILGIIWSVLNPILMMLLLNAVFSHIFRGDIDNFPLYLLSGQLIFNFFSDATSSALFSIVEAASLIKKVYVPKYIFPTEKVIFAFVNTVFTLIALILIMIITCARFSAVMFLAIIPLILLFIFTVGVSLLLSSFSVFLHDIKHLHSVVLTAWLYITPIFYSEKMLGETSWIYLIVRVNPLTWYITYFRDTMIYGAMPTVTQNLVCAGYAIGSFVLGAAVFKKLQDRFILYL